MRTKGNRSFWVIILLNVKNMGIKFVFIHNFNMTIYGQTIIRGWFNQSGY